MFAYLRPISYAVVFITRTLTNIYIPKYEYEHIHTHLCCAVKSHLSFCKINLLALTAGKWNNHQVIDVCDLVNDESVLSWCCQLYTSTRPYIQILLSCSMPFDCLNGVLIYGAQEIFSWRTCFKSMFDDKYPCCFESDKAN